MLGGGVVCPKKHRGAPQELIDAPKLLHARLQPPPKKEVDR